MVESGMYQFLAHNMSTILTGVQKNSRARREGTMIQCEMERCETLSIVSSDGIKELIKSLYCVLFYVRSASA